ncbi:SPX domain-containing membrane protein [Seminavis robusta]|uniref:SPX domain-containing membrane protein n=1 Tax=Seminavis robusta TaxID=568900 RepID=A0A9N8H3E6_9STRA|nr:SPX domain-containing membrane protein [Seminavis robusta]|eukprot:Sro37_g023340.1 SPX domain-containing membrane protein (807) ;mRNA; r:108749-111254
MKSFELYLSRSTRDEWSQHYMDYGGLKARLRQFYKRRRRIQKLMLGSALSAEEFKVLAGSEVDQAGYFQFVDSRSCRLLVDREDALLRLSIMERQEFSELLEAEISKSAIFFTETLIKELEARVAADSFEVAAQELLETMAFCVTNIITFRQVLIRYDGFRRTFDGIPLSEWHLQRSILGRRHPVHALFQLKNLYEFEKRLLLGMQEKGKVMEAEALSLQSECMLHLLKKTNDALDKAVAGHVVFKERVIATVRQYFLFGFQSRGLVHSPKVLMKGRHLKAELRTVAKWRETRSFPKTAQYPDTFARRLKQLNPENVFPLFLNLLSCFFFMMNNYIIEPSSAYYANALGSSDALSGIMIGAAPWFAMLSAVGYSYWTNYNYKMPIIFAGCLQMVGNFMYANAYSYSSMTMCLLGRVLTGLGAPRIINRRYVADATPFSLRTAASASFAMATALGAALGPGMAILLDNMTEFEFTVPFLEQQYFNGMTGPGYFMALCWGIYTVVIILFFKEPIRCGLDELKTREEALQALSTMTKSPKSEGGSKASDDSKGGLDRQDTSLTIEDGYDSDVSDGDTETASTYFMDLDSYTNKRMCSCLQHITTPVIITMSLIFMKRIALESIVGSTSIVTKNRYGWSIKNVGTLHLVNGLIVIPVSAISGWLSTYYEDRFMAVCFLVITLGGMAFLFDPSDLISHDNDTYNEDHPLSVGPIKYITGSLIAFSGIEACESFVASLMSKVVPSALATGTFNSGLLATLVGTGGRATGDLVITVMGLISIRNLLDLLIIPGAILVSISIFLIRYNYDILCV